MAPPVRRRIVLGLGLALCVLLCLALASSPDLEVETTAGPVLGFDDEATGTAQWRGVRYAAPPVGKLRWAPPAPPSPWTVSFNASSYGKSCWQQSSGTFGYDFKPSEDCLFANVARPRQSSSSGEGLLPVMVWIYGGAYTGGSSTYYPLGNLSVAANAVVVSFNYRIGIFGFFANAELRAQHRLNFGLLDQQFALAWVRDNAKAFGGDPENVLIFGESAGGASVSLHLLMQDSWPLYQRAISESPGPWQLPTLGKAYELSDGTTSGLNCSSQSPAEALKCLRSLQADKVFAFAVKAKLNDYFIPCVDLQQLTMEPTEMYNHSLANPSADVIVGSNLVEGNLFAELAKMVIGHLNLTELELELDAKLPAEAVAEIEAAYKSLISDGEYFRVLSDILGKYFIDCPTAIMSAALSQRPAGKGRTYRYLFTHKTHQWRFTELNATHTSELPYVFGSPKLLDANLTSPEWQLSAFIEQYWANFLRTGNPNKAGSASRADGGGVFLPAWPPFSPTKNTTMRLDLSLGTQATPDFPLCKLWDALVFLKASKQAVISVK